MYLYSECESVDSELGALEDGVRSGMRGPKRPAGGSAIAMFEETDERKERQKASSAGRTSHATDDVDLPRLDSPQAGVQRTTGAAGTMVGMNGSKEVVVERAAGRHLVPMSRSPLATMKPLPPLPFRLVSTWLELVLLHERRCVHDLLFDVARPPPSLPFHPHHPPPRRRHEVARTHCTGPLSSGCSISTSWRAR